MKIGVLAVQGAFIEHIHMLDKLGVIVCRARGRDLTCPASTDWCCPAVKAPSRASC